MTKEGEIPQSEPSDPQKETAETSNTSDPQVREHTLDEKFEPSGSPSIVVLEKEEKEDAQKSAQPEITKEARAPGTIAQGNEMALVPHLKRTLWYEEILRRLKCPFLKMFLRRLFVHAIPCRTKKLLILPRLHRHSQNHNLRKECWACYLRR